MVGLPGNAYHGGAVTCWAIIRAMVSQGHQVSLLSMYDTSEHNPYLKYRSEQEEEINTIGVSIHYVEYEYKNILAPKAHIENLFNIDTSIKYLWPWAHLSSGIEKEIRKLKPDFIFMYHFEPVAAFYFTNIHDIPTIGGMGDLWHLPGEFRSQFENKGTLHKIKTFYASFLSKRGMKRICQKINLLGFFPAHYADWFNQYSDRKDVLYFRTPSHDNSKENWQTLRDNSRTTKFKILLMGDLNSTVTSIGIYEFATQTLKYLDESIGEDNYEVHFVGGGEPPRGTEQYLLNKKSILFRGRVYPPDEEFLSCNVMVVPTPITLGIRVRIITAMSFGTPIVTHVANKAGIPELQHGKNCLIANDASEIGKLIFDIFENMDLQKMLEYNSKSTFMEYFSEQKAANQIIQIMENYHDK